MVLLLCSASDIAAEAATPPAAGNKACCPAKPTPPAGTAAGTMGEDSKRGRNRGTESGAGDCGGGGSGSALAAEGHAEFPAMAVSSPEAKTTPRW